MKVKAGNQGLVFSTVLLLVFCLAVSGKLAAQVPYFRNLHVESEAAESKARTLYQDKKGFIWLGTSNGLYRFNGFSYTHVGASDSSARQPVTAISEDRNGTLWVGFHSGKIATFTNGNFTFFNPEEGTPSVPVLAIHQSTDSTMWFATYGEGMYYLRNKHLYNINKDDGLKDDYVYTIAEDKTGSIWIGTDGGLAICSINKNRKKVKTITSAQGLPDNIVLSLTFCTDGALWIGTHSSGICRYFPKEQRFEAVKNKDITQSPVNKLVQVGNEVWAGTLGSGIVIYDQKNITLKQVFNKETGCLPKVTGLLQDLEGNIWIAGNSLEYQIANPQIRFVQLQTEEKLQNIHAVLHDRKGDLWVSNPDGLLQQRSDGSIKKYLQPAGNKKVQAVSLYEDHAGYIWIGTFGNGVFRLYPETGKMAHYHEGSGLINNNVLSVAGSEKEVWLATLGGVSRCVLPEKNAPSKNLTFENFSQANGLGVNYIYHVFVDSKNRVWFSTDGRGVTVLENGKFNNFTNKDGLQSEVVYTVTEDRQGRIWLNTLKGLHLLEDRQFRPFRLPPGQRANTFTSVIADRAGNLVLVHKQGIDVLKPTAGSVSTFGAESGLSSPDPNLNAVSRDSVGNIWIGMQHGLVQYRPAVEDRQTRPRIVLNEVQLFLKPHDRQQQPEFGHNQNHISFDYVGLWYHNPEQVSYQVKLEGYDSEWISSRNRFITYPNLPPGDYTFRVKASAVGDFEKAPEAVYTFTIKPPFWNTLPFYVVAAFVLASAGYTVVKTREKKLKAAERTEKEKVMFQFETLKSQVNPHFLFNSFNTLISIIEDDQQKAVTYVEKLSDFFRDMLVYREKDVITLKEELKLIGNYYFLQKQRFGENFMLEVSVNEPADQWYIAPLTLQLLVENAVKHNVVSKGHPLVVNIYQTNDGYLVVENSIRKKKHMEPSTKVGLENIVNRYRLLTNRPIKIVPSEDVFSVAVPLIS